jgi:hypothetical protein
MPILSIAFDLFHNPTDRTLRGAASSGLISSGSEYTSLLTKFRPAGAILPAGFAAS